MRGRIAAVLLLVFMTTTLCAQGSSDPTVDAQRHTTTPPAPSSAEIEMQKRAAKQRNEERFAQLKKDSDHLLELATELKKSVDAANDQTLSLEVVRKAEQIEKLAKQVRQKMMAQ
jgi:hypothetical protein